MCTPAQLLHHLLPRLQVLTRGAGGAAVFEPIYLYGHRDAELSAKFVQIFVEVRKLQRSNCAAACRPAGRSSNPGGTKHR
jgi:hypothetical protein